MHHAYLSLCDNESETEIINSLCYHYYTDIVWSTQGNADINIVAESMRKNSSSRIKGLRTLQHTKLFKYLCSIFLTSGVFVVKGGLDVETTIITYG